MSIVIKNGTIVTALDTYKADVLIEGEKISQIEDHIDAKESDTVIDASGKYIFPGGIDVHTHLEMPFMGTYSVDDFETGTRAALAGGTTTIIDFIIPEKGKPLTDALKNWHAKAKKAVSDYGFHMAITEYNESVASEIPNMVKEGVTSFKCFLAYKNVLQVDDGTFMSILDTVGKSGGMVSIHAENGDIIDRLINQFTKEGKKEPWYHYASHPEIAEEEAVQRGITLARFMEQPLYIVHLSSADGLRQIKSAQANGQTVYAETCPQYLLLDNENYNLPNFEGAKYVMSPPLRPKSHQKELWDGLSEGHIQVVATDHCPFNFEKQKEMGRDNFAKIPNGAPGVGDRVNLLYSYGVCKGRLSLNRFVDVMSTSPAKLFGMYPQKGTIECGSDADILIFDPKAPTTITAEKQYHNCDYNSFEGFKLEGQPDTVLLRGKFAVKDKKYVGKQGKGSFIARGRQ